MSCNQREQSRSYTPQQEREFKDRALKRKRANAFLDIIAGIAQDVEQDEYEADIARRGQVRNGGSGYIEVGPDAPRIAASCPPGDEHLIQYDEEAIDYKWAQVFNPANSLVTDARVIEDTGTQVNFISPKLAKACDLPVYATKPTVLQVITGQKFKADQWAQVDFIGKGGKIGSEWFYIAPREAPIELLVGKRFLNLNPDAFFDEKPTASGNSLLNVQAKMTEQERAQVLADQAAADAQAAELERRRRQKQQQKAKEKRQAESSKSSRSDKP